MTKRTLNTPDMLTNPNHCILLNSTGIIIFEIGLI